MISKDVKIKYKNIDIYYNENDDVWYCKFLDKYNTFTKLQAHSLKDVKTEIDNQIVKLKFLVDKLKTDMAGLKVDIDKLENILKIYSEE